MTYISAKLASITRKTAWRRASFALILLAVAVSVLMPLMMPPRHRAARLRNQFAVTGEQTTFCAAIRPPRRPPHDAPRPPRRLLIVRPESCYLPSSDVDDVPAIKGQSTMMSVIIDSDLGLPHRAPDVRPPIADALSDGVIQPKVFG